MALATKCPQCGALFRVVADQLKLRGGLVRCGQCRSVFDAIGSLAYVDDAALAQSKPSSAPEEGPATAHPEEAAGARQALGPSTTLRISPVAPATGVGHLAPRIELPKAPPDEPAIVRRRARESALSEADGKSESTRTEAGRGNVPTLVMPEATQDDVVVEPLDDAVEVIELPPPPAVDTSAATAPAPPEVPAREAPPSFSRRKRKKRRGFSIVFGGGSAALVLLAVLQLAIVFRSEVLVHAPQARPFLVDLCTVFGCTVSLPTRADQLAVIGTELQAIPGTDALELTAVIRNRAGFKQSLPAVEVTLTDQRNRPLARKVFAPADYLASAGEPSSRLEEGMAAGSDFTIRVFFEARGLTPAGFLVYPFYL